MRAFIAIELPDEIKDHLSRLQQDLKAAQADVKWVEPKNIHLTLKFLGEIDDKKLDGITKITEDTCGQKNRFPARICSLGAFPKTESPRVIWVGIDTGDKEVKQIAKELEERIAKIGIPKEGKLFSSHITIGRTRSSLGREKLVQGLNNKAVLGGEKIEFYVTKITLFRSTLTPKGPIYEPIRKISLITT